MRKKHILDYDILGSTIAWPVSVYISRDERTRVWTLLFRYTDPEHKTAERTSALQVEDFLWALEEHHCDAEEFCDALKATKQLDLMQLAATIRAEIDAQPK